MRWFYPLYIGERAAGNAGRVIADLEEGKKPAGDYYIVVLAAGLCNQLEVIPAKECAKTYYRNKDLRVIAVSEGRNEAFLLIEKIMNLCLKETGDADIRKYFENMPEASWKHAEEVGLSLL